MLTLGLILAAAGYIAGWPLLTIGGAIVAIYGAVKHYGSPPDDRWKVS